VRKGASQYGYKSGLVPHQFAEGEATENAAFSIQQKERCQNKTAPQHLTEHAACSQCSLFTSK
jgi:hypothetical protein